MENGASKAWRVTFAHAVEVEATTPLHAVQVATTGLRDDDPAQVVAELVVVGCVPLPAPPPNGAIWPDAPH